jgi:hypothetical protein
MFLAWTNAGAGHAVFVCFEKRQISLENEHSPNIIFSTGISQFKYIAWTMTNANIATDLEFWAE